MEEINELELSKIQGGIGFFILAAAVGFLAGWRIGRRVRRNKLKPSRPL